MHLLSATRRARSLTQADVASMAQISLPTLRALERGEGGVHALVAVMAVLGLRWGWAPDRTQAAAMLAARRRAKGLSQAELAVCIGVSRPTVIALERDLGGFSVMLGALINLEMGRRRRVVAARALRAAAKAEQEKG